MSRYKASLVAYGGDESDEGSEEEPLESGDEAATDGDTADPGDEQDGQQRSGDLLVSPYARNQITSPGANEDERPASVVAESPNVRSGEAREAYPFCTAGVTLPPPPSGVCDPHLEQRVRDFMNKTLKGYHFNEKLRSNKNFQNPHICEKLVESAGLDEFGSNCPEDIFSPREFGPDFFYDVLATKQRKWVERKERDRAMRTQIEFAGSSSAPSPTPGTGSTVGTGARAATAAAVKGLPLPLPKRPKI